MPLTEYLVLFLNYPACPASVFVFFVTSLWKNTSQLAWLLNQLEDSKVTKMYRCPLAADKHKLYRQRALDSVLEERHIINTSKNICTRIRKLSIHRQGGILQTGATPLQRKACYIITTFAILDNLKRKCKIFKKSFPKEEVSINIIYKPPKNDQLQGMYLFINTDTGTHFSEQT